MPSPPEESDAARQLRLVRKAVLLADTTPCFVWEESATRTVRSRCDGLQPSEVRKLAFEHVRCGGVIRQRREADEEWFGQRRFDHWYSVCFDVDGIDEPIFVKIVLHSDDEDYPEARIVGAHKSPR